MSFELFTDNRRGHKPKITIRGNGAISFNLGSIKKLELKTFQFVQLFYDKEDKCIGIKLSNNKDDKGILKLTIREDLNAWISARAFFNYYEIPLPEKNNSVPVEFAKDNEGMIILQYPGKKNTT